MVSDEGAAYNALPPLARLLLAVWLLFWVVRTHSQVPPIRFPRKVQS